VTAAGSGAVEPFVTLLSHVPYYRHAAVALDDAGYLERYLAMWTSTTPRRGAGLPLVGRAVEHVNNTRVFPELRGRPVTNLWAGQIGSQVAQRVFDRQSIGRALPARSFAWDSNARWHLSRRHQPKVLHAVSGIALHSARAAKARGAYIVIDVRAAYPRARAAAIGPALARHGIEYHMANEANLDRLDAEYELADLIVCCSELARDSFLEAGFAADRVAAIDLGCDTDRFVPALAPPEAFTALFVGRERREKGFVDVAAAARALAPTSSLLVSGDRDDAAVGWLAGVRATVEFLGMVPAARMPAVYQRGSVLVLPSLAEGFGMVVVEAMASGLPVIVSDKTGAVDAVTDGVNGFVIPAGDADALADRLRQLEADPALVASMGAASRERAPAYSWSAYGRHLVDLYDTRIIPALA
jgi:starch synthase